MGYRPRLRGEREASSKQGIGFSTLGASPSVMRLAQNRCAPLAAAGVRGELRINATRWQKTKTTILTNQQSFSYEVSRDGWGSTRSVVSTNRTFTPFHGGASSS